MMKQHLVGSFTRPSGLRIFISKELPSSAQRLPKVHSIKSSPSLKA